MSGRTDTIVFKRKNLRLLSGILCLKPFRRLKKLSLSRRAGTAIPPWEPSTALVTTGVYGLSRNPIYLGMILIYVGIAFVFAASWAFLLLLPVLVALQIEVIRREETYLERRFGEAYRHYRQEVRRWL